MRTFAELIHSAGHTDRAMGLVIAFLCWAEAHIKIARMTLTIKLDGNWSSFQLANSAPPLSVTDSAIAPSARMLRKCLRNRASHHVGICLPRDVPPSRGGHMQRCGQTRARGRTQSEATTPYCRNLLAAARKLATSREILLWMTPSEAPKALQASECSELLDPMRASCWISAQH